MKRRTAESVVVAAAVACVMLNIAVADVRSPVSAALPAATQPAAAEITLNGTFTAQGDHALKAVLKPSGANEWKVTFNFEWKNKPQTYVGTITGNLKNGEVNCTATPAAGSDGGSRRFGFKGTATNGVLTFECFETVDGSNKNRGKGTLK